MKHDVYYQAMLARDYRFDGKFFVGVKTTGVYCRPICPAKPLRKNVEFFPSATAAEKAGFRPCLRCRPESAPRSPAWMGTSAIIQRALKLIATQTEFAIGEDEFAAKFGVTARHLRRIFKNEIGQTPNQILQNNRLNFARKLIVETRLPMTSVALTAGFSSLRRFNDAFKKRFHRAPRELRKIKGAGEKGIHLTLSYRPPFDFESLLAFHRTHQVGGVENVTADAYERLFKAGETAGFLRVTHNPARLVVNLEVHADDPKILFTVAQNIRQMFDLDSDPLLVANCFEADRFLNSLWKKYPGLRIAKGWDPYETAIRTILGQLVSLGQARNLVHQLVQAYGQRVIHPLTGKEAFLFPDATTLARAEMAEVKTTDVRKATIREFSRMTLAGELNLFTPQDADSTVQALLGVRGLGPWSAEYISLRALGNTDSFPGTDLILKRAMDRHKNLDLEKIRPWRSYAAIYLWRHYAGVLTKRKGNKK